MCGRDVRRFLSFNEAKERSAPTLHGTSAEFRTQTVAIEIPREKSKPGHFRPSTLGLTRRLRLQRAEDDMEWETPSFEEIDMNAEIGSYQGDSEGDENYEGI